MPDLLIEIGCEELPSSACREAIAQAPGLLDSALADLHLAAVPAVAWVAPRRIAVFAGSVPYLKLAGATVAGWQMARALLVAEGKVKAGETDSFYSDKILTARFFADHVLSTVPGLRDSVVGGADAVTEMAVANF